MPLSSAVGAQELPGDEPGGTRAPARRRRGGAEHGRVQTSARRRRCRSALRELPFTLRVGSVEHSRSEGRAPSRRRLRSRSQVVLLPLEGVALLGDAVALTAPGWAVALPRRSLSAPRRARGAPPRSSSWAANGDPRRVLLLVRGLGEPSGKGAPRGASGPLASLARRAASQALPGDAALAREGFRVHHFPATAAEKLRSTVEQLGLRTPPATSTRNSARSR